MSNTKYVQIVISVSLLFVFMMSIWIYSDIRKTRKIQTEYLEVQIANYKNSFSHKKDLNSSSNNNFIFSIIVAVVGSGILSTIILVVDGRLKDKQRKQDKIKEKYNELVRNMDFLYEKHNTIEKKNFLKTYRQLFLEADDDVIEKINNNFIDPIISEPSVDSNDMKEKKKKIADTILKLRRQSISNTNIKEEDFRHVQ